MIMNNEFPKYEHLIKKVDSKLFFANLDIRKAEAPRNEAGVIYLPDSDNEKVWGGMLVHEVSHTLYHPVTVENYINLIHTIKKNLHIEGNLDVVLANIASDIVVSYEITKDRFLNDLRAETIKYYYSYFGNMDVLKKELLGICNKLHGCGLDVKSSTYNKIIKVLRSNKTREQKCLDIARIFLNLHKKGSEQGEDQSDYQGEGSEKDKSDLAKNAIEVTREEAEETFKRILEDSKDVEEAKEKVNILMRLAKGLGKEGGKAISSNLEFLKAFYQTKANQVRLFVKYPSTIAKKGVSLGSRKWKFSDGIQSINIKKTIYKFGLNIPLVTTRTNRILNKFISSNNNVKPLDLVVSIDTSGSVGRPEGYLINVADYEIIMFYALLDLAKRIDQKVGLTLWNTDIHYTTLPEVFDWRDLEKLKEDILKYFWEGMTNIYVAIRQANEYKDKIFFIFTDGDVSPEHLIENDNSIFFLINPPDQGNIDMFTNKYGEGRVIVIRNLEDIPRITLNNYLRIFKG